MLVRFGPYTLDDQARTLQRDRRAVHLSPKAFELLTMLVRARPAAIAKSGIHEHLWPDTFVSDGNVAVLIAEIRSALDDSAQDSRYIRTVQRFGYAFSAATDERPLDAGSTRRPAPCWLSWGARRVPLSMGDNVIGRDPAADVYIDAVGISRRHALIAIDGEQVTLVDLSSKNGTFINGTRITARVPLAGDTELRLGPMPVRFCRVPSAASTETWDASHARSQP